LYPKKIKYSDILNQKIKVYDYAVRLAMYNEVLLPIFNANDIEGSASCNYERTKTTLNHFRVDLPPGILTIRDILNFCCAENPMAAFYITPVSSWNPGNGKKCISPLNLRYDNPLASPRVLAIKIWEAEIGKTASNGPTMNEISIAMSDPNPRKRWAALNYYKSSEIYYNTDDIINNTNRQNGIWTTISLKSIETISEDQKYLSSKINAAEFFTNRLFHTDYSLALLVSMELAVEKNDASVMNVLLNHKFSASEISIIKPDIIRLARHFKLIRDQLMKMHIEDTDFSPNHLIEMERAKIIVLEN
jgi:hypothetical protein